MSTSHTWVGWSLWQYHPHLHHQPTHIRPDSKHSQHDWHSSLIPNHITSSYVNSFLINIKRFCLSVWLNRRQTLDLDHWTYTAAVIILYWLNSIKWSAYVWGLVQSYREQVLLPGHGHTKCRPNDLSWDKFSFNFFFLHSWIIQITGQ